MNTKNVFGVVGVLAIVLFTVHFASQNPAPWAESNEQLALVTAANEPAPAAPGQYIVQFKNGTQNTAALAKQLVTANQGELKQTFTKALSGFAAKLSDQAVQALSKNPNVVRIQPDHLVSMEAKPSSGTTIPWGIDRIDQRDLPLNNTYTSIAAGEGVNVYVIDSGIRLSHVEFGGRAVGAHSLVNDGNGANDCNGHGTHVAGTIGGNTVGVARKATLQAVRIFNCAGDSIPESTVLAALDWVAQNKISPAVINLSIGGVMDNTVVNDAVENMIALGVPVVVAAGNAAADACLYTPASAPNAITVAASNRYDQGAGFSNYGTCVDIFAPGSGIRSAGITSDTSYAENSGTSMATPHVTGVAALFLSQNPTATPADVSSAILGNATPGKLTYIRPGSPNFLLYSLIDAAIPPPPTVFSITSYGVSAIYGNSATVSWTTSEPSTGEVTYYSTLKGKNGPAVTLYDNNLSMTHIFNLTALANSTTYNYTVTTTNGTDSDNVAGSFKTTR